MIFPVFRWFGEAARLDAGLRMIREHSRWLTRALGGRRTRPLPRIPVRKVSEGGFGKLMSTPVGRFRAERWWERTLQNLDD
jgi:hypothetical protein